MANRAEIRIYRLAGMCGILIAASFIVPRFISNPEGGFASGASAILALLVMLAVALLFSLYLFTVTLKQYGNLSTPAKLVGLGPCLLLAVVLFGLMGFLRY